MKRHWHMTLGLLAAILAARAYVQKRFRRFLADSANLKRNITVEAMTAREALTRLADEMDRLDSASIEAENANLPADATGMSTVIRRAEAMHEEPWEFVYDYINHLDEHDQK